MPQRFQQQPRRAERVVFRRVAAEQAREIGGEQLEARMTRGARPDELDDAGAPAESVLESGDQRGRDGRRRQIVGHVAQGSPERVGRDETAIEKVRQAAAKLQGPQAGEHELDAGILGGQRTRGAHRPIERFVGEARRLGLVRHAEPGIEVCLERKLAQQAETERVDRADRDVAEVVPEGAPAHGIDPAFVGDPVQPREDAIAHLGSGLAGEGDRQDVARLDAGANQVDVAVDEHVRLARAGRGLEHDIQARVDRGRAIGGVGQRRRRGRRRRGVLKRQARRRRLRFRHSPCGRPWPRHTWCRGCAARDAAETLRG